MKRLSILFFLLTTGVVFAQVPVLVTPEWVNAHRTDNRIVMLQVGALQYDYDTEHIAGARFLWSEWLAPNSPYGNFNMPDVTAATTVLRTLGISEQSHVVVYYVRNELPLAARMFLTLENLGLRGKVSVLNGGLDAWKKAGYSVTVDVPVVKKGNIRIKPGDVVVDNAYVLKTLNTASGVVADARPKPVYEGEPSGNPRDGHIAGALSLPYVELIQESNALKAPEELNARFSPLVSDTKKEIVTYCQIGQTASVVYLAGRAVGLDMKVYDGSMQEWSRLKELPMEKSSLKEK